MKRLIIEAALLALGAAAAAQPRQEAIENRYGRWRSVAVDQDKGEDQGGYNAPFPSTRASVIAGRGMRKN